MITHLKQGDKAPDFSAKNQKGETLWEIIIGIIKEHKQIKLNLN